MKFNLLLSILFLLFLCGRYNVNSGLQGKIRNWAWGAGLLERVSDQMALILVVEKSGRTYLANNHFVAIRMNELYDKFLFLCPAETDEQGKIENSSTTQNVLFIKKIHQNIIDIIDNDTKDDKVIHNCVKPVKPSIKKIGSSDSNPDVDLYFVGYEVYLDSDANSYNVDDYFSRAGLQDMRFKWFNVYTIAFNREKRSVVNVFSHSLAYRNLPLPTDSPFDYSLGKKEFLGDIDMHKIYNTVNQEIVFKELYKGVSQSVPQYVIAVHLAHLDSFGIPLLRQAGMTSGNMAPMFTNVYDHSWRTVEKLLDALARGLNAISVITGVYGTLELYGITYYLESAKTIEVPAAFFKIVSYSPNNEEKYNMVIVTNNNPYAKDDINEKICKENQCKEFSWDLVRRHELHILERTTCCQLTNEVLTELKLQDYSSLVGKTLDLKKVPHWKDRQFTLNIKEYIRDQIKNLDYSKRSDDDIYINEKSEEVHNRRKKKWSLDKVKDFLSGLISHVPDDTDRESEEITFSKFITTLYKNYVFPYFINNH